MLSLTVILSSYQPLAPQTVLRSPRGREYRLDNDGGQRAERGQQRRGRHVRTRLAVRGHRGDREPGKERQPGVLHAAPGKTREYREEHRAGRADQEWPARCVA